MVYNPENGPPCDKDEVEQNSERVDTGLIFYSLPPKILDDCCLNPSAITHMVDAETIYDDGFVQPRAKIPDRTNYYFPKHLLDTCVTSEYGGHLSQAFFGVYNSETTRVANSFHIDRLDGCERSSVVVGHIGAGTVCFDGLASRVASSEFKTHEGREVETVEFKWNILSNSTLHRSPCPSNEFRFFYRAWLDDSYEL